jgi:NADH-quinone oxidoreductase subunit H
MKLLLELIIFDVIRAIGLIVPMLLAVAYLTLFERKILASVQIRTGPNVVGFFGLLQPLADGVKLLLKELTHPTAADKVVFYVAPIITFFIAVLSIAVIPFSSYEVLVDFEFGIIFVFAVSSLGIYGIILSGWASNSRYAILGSLRSTAQIVSYEVSIGLIIQTCLIVVGSINLTDLLEFQAYIWLFFPLFPSFVLFFISSLAETNRPPFDLPEAEAELVSGYNVEYSAVTFALFFIGEYLNIIVSSVLITILFFGGGNFFFLNNSFIFSLKVLFFMFAFVWVRATVPRLRYDQLMQLGWKVLLPLSFGWFTFIFVIVSIWLFFLLLYPKWY